MRPSRSATSRFEMKCKRKGCGVIFDAKMRTARFCSQVCQRKDYRRRMKLNKKYE